MEKQLKKTSLYEKHKELNGNIIDFHGVLLPVFYSSIQEEHNNVRTNLGVFDVSHMGNFIMEFPDQQTAIDTLNYFFANSFTKIEPGKIVYTLMLYENGTVVDDLIVMAISETKYHIIVNYANIAKDFKHMSSLLNNNQIKFQNLSDEYSIIAVQGPNARDFLERSFGYSLAEMRPFRLVIEKYQSEELIVSRTGYTGEDGFELTIKNEIAPQLYSEILKKGKDWDLLPCGLGARDTLRLEAGLPLYGQDLDDQHSPLQSMMGWSIKMKKKDFLGMDALKNPSPQFKDIMVGFEVTGKAIPRTGMDIINSEGKKIGTVTSGSFAPYIKKNIGLAYIDPEYQEKPLKLLARNREIDIQLTAIPFYKRSKK
ncbi:MAG: glycine cleavage system aminomethyltransferase GcvT [Spirochaetes bacterium]|nr:glycine cleavage system aminomethyltransferase GcvT [Spirochaetota bacterium]